MATDAPVASAEQDTTDASAKPMPAVPLHKLPPRAWAYAMKRSVKGFSAHGCTDLAAALTYFSVLSIFPALLAMVSILGLVGEPEETKQTVLDVLDQLGQADAVDIIGGPLDQMVNSPAAGVGLFIGLGGALWSASGYVGAFGRALNTIYGVEEGRGFLKLRPVQLAVTAVLLVLASMTVLAIAVSGGLARAIGGTIGLGEPAVMTWNLAKWPVILLVIIFMIGLLYWSTPNVKRPWRWLSAGAAVALIVAILASVAFGFYVTNFGSYNKTYGSLAGVIVFLLWIWIINNVLLFGGEVDSELLRSRQLQAGMPVEEGRHLPPRDTTKTDAAAAAEEVAIEDARTLRIKGLQDQGRSTAELAPDTK